MAAAAAPLIISAVSKITAGLLAAHTARLKGATSENAALVQVIPAFDDDIKGIVNAYNTGQASAQQAIVALQAVDNGIKAYLKAQVGKPGTAWNDSVGIAGKCDKTCTAGCCVYFGDLGPPLSLVMVALGGQGTNWGSNDPRISSGPSGVTVQIPQVFGSKFGGTNRAAYTLTVLNRPGSSANPPQFAQNDFPPIPPRLGLVSDGTVQGQTSTFSTMSQGLLDNSAAVYSPAGVSVATNSGTLLIGAGIIIAGLVAYLATR